MADDDRAGPGPISESSGCRGGSVRAAAAPAVGERVRVGEADADAEVAAEFRRSHSGEEGDMGDVAEVGKHHGPDVGTAPPRIGTVRCIPTPLANRSQQWR